MVRAAVAAQRKGNKRPPHDVGGSAHRQDRPSDLGALIARRVGAISADDTDRDRKLFRAFLEATLLAELGEQLVNDPGFSHMVDAVQEQMEGDPHIAAAVSQAVRLLVTPPPA